ncbi:MAG TPA: DUF6088 family protein [bacterium]|nr:DUF6088 family protein [bacterium]
MVHAMQGLDTKILNRVRGKGKGSLVMPGDLLDLGTRRAIDVALHRLVKKGVLRRLARGIYDLPRTHPELGLLMPSADEVAKALAGRDRTRLQPSGAYAANLLGLSTQVPMKIVFLTDGPSKRVRIGKAEIILKRTTPKNMATAGTISGLIIQALRYLGRNAVDETIIAQLRSKLDTAGKNRLSRDAALAPAWIGVIMRQLAAE